MIAAITNRDLAAVILILAFFVFAVVYMVTEIGVHARNQIGAEIAAAGSLGSDGTAELNYLSADDSLGDAA